MTEEDSDGSEPEPDADPLDRVPDLSRRQFLAAGAGTISIAGAAKAVDNVYLGYGQFGMGTNLLEQDLDAMLRESLRFRYDEMVDGNRIRTDGTGLSIEGAVDDRFSFGRGNDGRVKNFDADLGLDGRLVGAYEDGRALTAGDFSFEFYRPEAFFDRVVSSETRPDAIAFVRRSADRAVDPGVIADFTGADPSDSRAIVEGLVVGFREHSHYDLPRYLAGSIEDNVIFRAHDLRQYFVSPVDFESLLGPGSTGMFCWEYVDRSREALQATSPWAQSVPVAVCRVADWRHKHAYTGIASAIHDGGELIVPVTFVDYTRSTLHDDFKVRRVMGEGLAAYDSSHRATMIRW